MNQKVRALVLLGASALLTTAFPQLFSAGDVAKGFALVFIPGLIGIAIWQTVEAFKNV